MDVSKRKEQENEFRNLLVTYGETEQLASNYQNLFCFFSECVLLSSNFIQNDGTIHVKYHRHHHLYMKLSCSTSFSEIVLPKCLLNDIHCNCHESLCQHGACLTEQSEGYQRMFCECDYGFTGQLCEQMIDV